MSHKKHLHRFKNKFKEISYHSYNDTEFGEMFDFDHLFVNRMKRATHSHPRRIFKPIVKNTPED